MKNRASHFCLLLIIILSTIVITTAERTEAAAPGKAFTKVKLNSFGTNTSYDITGDGWADTIQFVHNGAYSSYTGVSVLINGTMALREVSSYGYYGMEAWLLRLKNGKVYLLLNSSGEHEEGDIAAIYRYSSGKLDAEVNLAKPYLKNYFFSLWGWSLSGNRIKVTLHGSSISLGRFLLSTTLTYKNGRLRLASQIPFKKISKYYGLLGGGKYYRTTRALQGYSSYKGNKKTIKIAKGTKIKFLKYYPGKKSRIQVQLNTGRKCWITDTNKSAVVNEIYIWA